VKTGQKKTGQRLVELYLFKQKKKKSAVVLRRSTRGISAILQDIGSRPPESGRGDIFNYLPPVIAKAEGAEWSLHVASALPAEKKKKK